MEGEINDTDSIVLYWRTSSDHDDYKQSFHKLCTVDFTNEWINKIEILRQWLIRQL
ncbi:MAG: hypothetical protein M0Q53_17140 [Prolixibacteraceae bacterium]|jgi:hypothetical protein|nr:hypothetical protein [Prolixibacteraceae bacterium]